MLNQFKNPENQTPCFVIHNVFTPERCQEIIDQYKNKVSKASHDNGKGGLTSADLLKLLGLMILILIIH